MSLEKTLRNNQLLAFYGSLLTDKQREMMSAYYEEDFSLGEIADNYQISRQAVHDNIKRSEGLLEDYEAKLHLMSRSNQRLKWLQDLQEQTHNHPQAQDLIQQLIQYEQ